LPYQKSLTRKIQWDKILVKLRVTIFLSDFTYLVVEFQITNSLSLGTVGLTLQKISEAWKECRDKTYTLR
jgi:hypothetical protein